jgi:hypothetical protein
MLRAKLIGRGCVSRDRARGRERALGSAERARSPARTWELVSCRDVIASSVVAGGSWCGMRL